MKGILFIFFISTFLINASKAEEGMWIPFEMDTQNIKNSGLEIAFDKLYSDHEPSIKDAVVIFGGGCTGELISEQGLILTNHHCGYYFIASQSDTNHNYLKNGFWANSYEEELPNSGLTVSIIKEYRNITKEAFEGVISNDIPNKDSIININLKKIIKEEKKRTNNDIIIKSTFNSNNYYLVELETFNDVRLVGTPALNIGNYGGEYDNWTWPRHTADFSVFRIYADSNNKPAPFSLKNRPYVAKNYLKMNIKDIQENDFCMVYGFPGYTSEYISSKQLESDVKNVIPLKIKLRENYLNTLKGYMSVNEKDMLWYASQNNKISNYYKKMKGQLIGIENFNVLDVKKSIEFDINTRSSNLFESVLNDLNKNYINYNQLVSEKVFLNEGVQMISFFKTFKDLQKINIANSSDESLKTKCSNVNYTLTHQKNIQLEKETFKNFIDAYISVDTNILKLKLINYIHEHYGNTNTLVNSIYAESFFVNTSDYSNLSNKKINKKIKKDPIWLLYQAFMTPERNSYMNKIDSLQQILETLENKYTDLYLKFKAGNSTFYPDANGSMRISYGKIKSYINYSNIQTNYFTDVASIQEMENRNKEHEEYIIPKKLSSLFNTKDFGRYGINNNLKMCFLSTNHTTGGNSGSPVLNGRGELIGLNFDRSWESTMSDYYYSEKICRNISVTTNYLLFIIDKYANCQHIMKELTIIE